MSRRLVVMRIWKQVDGWSIDRCAFPFLSVTINGCGQPPAARGAAWRRRQRRLRSMLRHERQTVAMELAAAFHQSWCGGLGMNVGLRAQNTASAVLPCASTFSLMMAGPQGRSGRRHCLSRGRSREFSGTPWSTSSRSVP